MSQSKNPSFCAGLESACSSKALLDNTHTHKKKKRRKKEERKGEKGREGGRVREKEEEEQSWKRKKIDTGKQF